MRANKTHTDTTGDKMGMWLFLFTELMLFIGMFLLYAIYRYMYINDFQQASGELSRMFGIRNTFILLTSSLTMVLSVLAVKRGEKRASAGFLSATIILGLLFLVNKYMEWSDKILHGIYSGSAELLKHSKGEILFYGLYYAMTDRHARFSYRDRSVSPQCDVHCTAKGKDI